MKKNIKKNLPWQITEISFGLSAKITKPKTDIKVKLYI